MLLYAFESGIHTPRRKHITVQWVRSVCVGLNSWQLKHKVNGLMWSGLSWTCWRFAPSAVLSQGTSRLPPRLQLSSFNIVFSLVILNLFLLCFLVELLSSWSSNVSDPLSCRHSRNIEQNKSFGNNLQCRSPQFFFPIFCLILERNKCAWVAASKCCFRCAFMNKFVN